MRMIRGIGIFFLTMLKAVLWIMTKVVLILLEAMKLFLLLFGMVMRIFLVFVRAATP
jgi:hypothetical protein